MHGKEGVWGYLLGQVWCRRVAACMGEAVCWVTCRAGRLDSRLVVCTVAVRGQQTADNLGETDKLDMYTGTAKQRFVAVAKIAAGD